MIDVCLLISLVYFMSFSIKSNSPETHAGILPAHLDKKAVTKELILVGEDVKEIERNCVRVLRDLEDAFQSISKVLSGHTKEIKFEKILTTIDDNISKNEKSLAQLPTSETSVKIEEEIRQCRQAVDVLKQKSDYLVKLNQPELTDAYQLQDQVNEKLLEIGKNPNHAIVLIKQAVDIYNQIQEPNTDEAKAKVLTIKAYLNRKIESESTKALSLTSGEKKLKAKIDTKKPLQNSDRFKVFSLLAKERALAAYITNDSVWVDGAIDYLKNLQNLKNENHNLFSKILDENSNREIELFGEKNFINEGSKSVSLAVSKPKMQPEQHRGGLAKLFVDRLLKKDIMRLKISDTTQKSLKLKTGLLDSVFQRQGMRVAKSVNTFGTKCLKVDKYLDKVMLDVSRGDKDEQLKTKIDSIDLIIAEAQGQLQNFELELVKMPPGSFGMKLERAITRQSMLVDSLIQKKHLLDAMATTEYVQAANCQREISKLLDEASKDEKQAGFKIFQAQKELNALKDLLKGVDQQEHSIIYPKIHQMIGIANEKIRFAVREGVLELTDNKIQLKNNLLTPDATDFMKKLIAKPKESARRLAIMFSKEIASLTYETNPIKKQQKINDIHTMIEKLRTQSSLLMDVYNEGKDIKMEVLFKEFDKLAEDVQKKAIRLQTEIERLLVADNKQQAGLYLLDAINKYHQLEELAREREGIDPILDLVKTRITLALDLTADETRAKGQLLAGKVPSFVLSDSVLIIKGLLQKEMSKALGFGDQKATENAAMILNFLKQEPKAKKSFEGLHKDNNFRSIAQTFQNSYQENLRSNLFKKSHIGQSEISEIDRQINLQKEIQLKKIDNKDIDNLHGDEFKIFLKAMNEEQFKGINRAAIAAFGNSILRNFKKDGEGSKLIATVKIVLGWLIQSDQLPQSKAEDLASLIGLGDEFIEICNVLGTDEMKKYYGYHAGLSSDSNDARILPNISLTQQDMEKLAAGEQQLQIVLKKIEIIMERNKEEVKNPLEAMRLIEKTGKYPWFDNIADTFQTNLKRTIKEVRQLQGKEPLIAKKT